ncbi:hypothetical protein ACIF8W_28450 [Streptomyces sp. NPDC085639]|uniref:hypothetical protein n=1 Tax=Streptomyces sp. NPDC085639 TaxID=3365734 RepID=UPI0037D4B645
MSKQHTKQVSSEQRPRPAITTSVGSPPAVHLPQPSTPVTLDPWDTEGEDDLYSVESTGGVAVDFEFRGAVLPGVLVSFGDLFAKERRREISAGWGYSVELPAVLDLLEHVEQGVVEAGAARALLSEAAETLYGPFGCRAFEDPAKVRVACRAAGGCSLCEERRSWFEELLDHSDLLWERLHQPMMYPFAAGRRGIHDTTCAVVRRETPDNYRRPAGEAYTQALHHYSHSVVSYDRDVFESARSYPSFTAMTAEEARAWIAERTGPKGGRNYTWCQRCAPAL